MSEKSSIKHFLGEHKRDLVFLLSLIVFTAILTVVLALLSPEGDTVIVEVDGEEVARYALSESGEYPIGEGNLLAIENGYAYMKEADCKTLDCVHTGKISRGNQSIICRQNKVTVRIASSGEGPDLESS